MVVSEQLLEPLEECGLVADVTFVVQALFADSQSQLAECSIHEYRQPSALRLVEAAQLRRRLLPAVEGRVGAI